MKKMQKKQNDTNIQGKSQAPPQIKS
jgi:hypothetical protein